MKADFFKRIFAYLIDYFIIIMIVLMGITASVNVGSSDLTKEINDVMNDYKEEILLWRNILKR